MRTHITWFQILALITVLLVTMSQVLPAADSIEPLRGGGRGGGGGAARAGGGGGGGGTRPSAGAPSRVSAPRTNVSAPSTRPSTGGAGPSMAGPSTGMPTRPPAVAPTRPSTGTPARPSTGVPPRVENRPTGGRGDTNIDRDINIDKDINVNVDSGWGWHDGGGAAGFATGLAVGAIVTSIPPSCTTAYVGGVAYQQCGSTYYTPVQQGTTVVYQVVSPPAY